MGPETHPFPSSPGELDGRRGIRLSVPGNDAAAVGQGLWEVMHGDQAWAEVAGAGALRGVAAAAGEQAGWTPPGSTHRQYCMVHKSVTEMTVRDRRAPGF